MTIQEAMVSKKPFRRRGWADDDLFLVFRPGDLVFTPESQDGTFVEIYPEDILANDWYTRESASGLN